jgi:hypothetical protein
MGISMAEIGRRLKAGASANELAISKKKGDVGSKTT